MKQGTGVYVGNLLTPQPTAPVTSTSSGTPPVVTISPASSSFTETGASTDSDVITVRLQQSVQTTTTIDLGFSGTAVANLDYTISAGTDAVTNSPSLPVQIVIPAGQTFGTITLTGAGLTLSSNESVGLSVISVNGVAPAAPVNANLTIGTTGFPVISIENLTVIEPGTPTAQVTIQLSGNAPSNMTVDYMTAVDVAHPGTTPAIASAYTAVSSPTPVTIPMGQSSVTVGIPVTGDPNATGPETFLVELVGTPSQGVYAPSPNSTATVTLVEQQPLISVENLTLIGGTAETAEVVVRLAQSVNGPIKLNYSTAADTVHPGTIPATSSGSNAAYTPISSASVTIPAGETEVTIPISILASTFTEDETFLVNFSVASGYPGVLVSNNPSATSPAVPAGQATVTLLAANPANISPLQFQQANSLTNATVDTSASGPNSPADTSGAVGPNSLVLFDSNNYQVFNKSTGAVSQSMTLNQFWDVALGADLPAGDTVFQPHVVYDPTSQRWYASALDEGIPAGSSGPLDTSNNILLAVSLTSDPTQGWVGFSRAVGSTTTVADFDSLGFNTNSVVVTANIYTIQTGALADTAVLSVPKANLISATTPNAASVTTAESYFSNLSDTESSYDPAVDYDSTVNEYLLAQNGTAGPVLETVSGGGGPTASVSSAAVAVTVSSGTLDENFPVVPPQPAGAPPLTTGPGIQTVGLPTGETGSLTDSLSNDFSGTAVLINGDLWAAQTVASGGADVIQWMEINVATDTVIQHGLINDVTGKGLNFYYPSLSVDSNNDVVIGFDGSSLTQQISSYAVYGTTTSGVTTFTSPSLLKQGTGIYAGFSDASPASAALTATIPSTTTAATTFTTTGTATRFRSPFSSRPRSDGRLDRHPGL